MSRQSFISMWLLSVVVLVLSLVRNGNAFFPPVALVTRPNRRPITLFASRDSEYFRRLQQAAQDPVAFERFVMASSASNSTEATSSSNTATMARPRPPQQPRKNAGGGGYQRVEEWNDQRNGATQSWEEKVQFDGQRFGNQFKQNEILRHNLNTF